MDGPANLDEGICTAFSQLANLDGGRKIDRIMSSRQNLKKRKRQSSKPPVVIKEEELIEKKEGEDIVVRKKIVTLEFEDTARGKDTLTPAKSVPDVLQFIEEDVSVLPKSDLGPSREHGYKQIKRRTKKNKNTKKEKGSRKNVVSSFNLIKHKGTLNLQHQYQRLKVKPENKALPTRKNNTMPLNKEQEMREELKRKKEHLENEKFMEMAVKQANETLLQLQTINNNVESFAKEPVSEHVIEEETTVTRTTRTTVTETSPTATTVTTTTTTTTKKARPVSILKNKDNVLFLDQLDNGTTDVENAAFAEMDCQRYSFSREFENSRKKFLKKRLNNIKEDGNHTAHQDNDDKKKRNEEMPTTTIATLQENKPVTLQENKPVTLQGNKPVTLQGNKPVTLQGNKPSTPVTMPTPPGTLNRDTAVKGIPAFASTLSLKKRSLLFNGYNFSDPSYTNKPDTEQDLDGKTVMENIAKFERIIRRSSNGSGEILLKRASKGARPKTPLEENQPEWMKALRQKKRRRAGSFSTGQ